jgi:hypothetical protein
MRSTLRFAVAQLAKLGPVLMRVWKSSHPRSGGVFYHRAGILRRAPLAMIPTGNGQRIIHTAIIEKLTRVARGKLVPLTPGSTGPVAEVRQLQALSRYCGLKQLRRKAP